MDTAYNDMNEEQKTFMTDVCNHMLQAGSDEYEAYYFACDVWDNKEWLKSYLSKH